MPRLTSNDIYKKVSEDILPDMSKDDLWTAVCNFFSSNDLEDFARELYINNDVEFEKED